MHELSLSLNILDLVDKSAGEGNAGKVHEVNIEVGGLSGVDGGILEEALRMVSSKTTFSKVRWTLIYRQAFGSCEKCSERFPMSYLWDACPSCGQRAAKITEGGDLEVVSIILSG
jgi:hydrogenase nickel incorporation protein HypA/HybF